MKKLLTFAASALAAACVMAQDGPRRAEGGRPHGDRPPPGMGMGGSGAWVTRMLSNRENLAKIGLADEEKQNKLVEALSALREKSEDLEKKIRMISREQARLMRELLEDGGRDDKAVLEKIDEVAKLRAEQGRLAVKSILVARDNLTPEQLKKARELISEKGRMRGGMRRGDGADGEGPRAGCEGPRGGGGEKHRGPRGKKGRKGHPPTDE